MTAMDLASRYSGEVLLTARVGNNMVVLPQADLFDNTHFRLSINRVGISLDTECPEFRIDPSIGAMAQQLLAHQQQRLGSSLTDSSTIRLNKFEANNDAKLFVSRARYFDYISTNYSMDVRLEGWERSLRDTVQPSNKLCDLERSLLANHIGVSALLLTSDNYLILPVRSRDKVNIWSEQIHTSVSGAADFDLDTHAASPFLISTLFREAYEELGVGLEDFDMDRLNFLGLTRELLRGGKPEAFFSASIRLSKEQVEANQRMAPARTENSRIIYRKLALGVGDRAIRTEQAQGVFSNATALEHVLAVHWSKMSLPALTNTVLWLKWVQSYSEQQAKGLRQ